jgi:TPR repeat protein
MEAIMANGKEQELESAGAKRDRIAAEGGDADAQWRLARRYELGDGVTEDYKKSTEWCRRAAEAGHAYAQFKLGTWYLSGDGVPFSETKAAEWYAKAAESGQADAQHELTKMYEIGYGVPKDWAKAAECYRKAEELYCRHAELGDAEAKCWLAREYEYGDRVPQDKVKTLEWFKKAAKAGSIGAQCWMGRAHLFGTVRPMDMAVAAKWLQKAADQGDGMAMYGLGIMYYNGWGFPKDNEKALELWLKATEHGDWDVSKRASHKVSQMLEAGLGAPQDLEKAAEYKLWSGFHWDSLPSLGTIYRSHVGNPQKDRSKSAEWHKKGPEHIRSEAERGDAEAQCMLAESYIYDQKHDEAHEWFKKAAEQYRRRAKLGEAEAQYKLAHMYLQGEGVPRNRAKARELWKKAAEQFRLRAEQGEAYAQYRLGAMYEWGVGVPKDQEKAAELYQMAAEAGDVEAQTWIGYKHLGHDNDDDDGTFYDVPLDVAKAAEWFLKAAMQGDGDAMSCLGGMYFNCRGFPQDFEKALDWCKKSAKAAEECEWLGDRFALLHIGEMYETGVGVPKDVAKAAEWYYRAMQRKSEIVMRGSEDSESLEYIAMEYGLPPSTDFGLLVCWAKSFGPREGDGAVVIESFEPTGVGAPHQGAKDALGWWQKAEEQCQRDAERGDADAQYRLGWMFDKKANDREHWPKEKYEAGAAKWYRKAARQYRQRAEQGEAYAQFRLAEMYEYGKGVRKNYAKAAEWYAKAESTEWSINPAWAGRAHAMYELGWLVRNAWGEPKHGEKELAATIFSAAAEQGHAAAQCKLGTVYFEGDGVPKDFAKAMEWYEKSAEQGYVVAQSSLGEMYEKGHGVPKNRAKAIEWYTKAAEQGYLNAQRRLRAIKGKGRKAPEKTTPTSTFFDDSYKMSNDRPPFLDTSLSEMPTIRLAKGLHSLASVDINNWDTHDYKMESCLDMWSLAQNYSLEGKSLLDAVYVVFDYNGTSLPESMPASLGDEFAKSCQQWWQEFHQRRTSRPVPESFLDVVAKIRSLIEPLISPMLREDLGHMVWEPSLGWHEQNV